MIPYYPLPLLKKIPTTTEVLAKKGHFYKEIHETLVGILLFLTSVHICGVIASSYMHRENLVVAMITGYKKSAAK